MRPRHALSCFVLMLLVTTVSAQVIGSAGPSPAPLGCPIQVTISNDTAAPVSTGACPFSVRNAAGQTVYAPQFCILIIIIINPGEAWSTPWNQRDNSGVPVPAGNYIVDLTLPTNVVVSLPIQIDAGIDAAMTMLGTPRIGATRNLFLCSGQDGGYPFVAGASLSAAPGILSCGGVVPLTPDVLFFFSITPNNGVFLNFQGTLDAQGETTNPAVAIPPDPGLIGGNFVLDFVVADPMAFCPVRRIAAPYALAVQ